MNLVLFFSYSSILKFKFNLLCKKKNQIYTQLYVNFSIFLFTLNNEFSNHLLALLNSSALDETCKYKIKTYHQFSIKKEFCIFKKKNNTNSYFNENYKNSTHWNISNWLIKKEFSIKTPHCFRFFSKVEIIDSKNFHSCDFFYNFLFFTKINIIKKLLLVSDILLLDNFNQSIWKFSSFLWIKIQNMKINWSFFFLKMSLFFFCESKWKFIKEKKKYKKNIKNFIYLLLNSSNFV